VVTTGDLTGLKNIGTIEFTNDQAAPQTSVLQLDNASVDALVNSSRVAATGFEETLTVRAYDNPTVPAATTTLNVDASQVTNAALQVNIAGAGGADTIVGGAGNDAIDGGAGIDSIGLGSGGTDTVVFDAANATSADGDLITGFTAGAGAGFDIMQLDVSDVGAGIIAGLTANVVNVAGSANNSIIVDTASTDYANFAAAEAAVQAANAATTDYLLTFFNTTTNRLEVYADADSSAAGGEVLLATFDDVAVTGAANTFMNTLTAGNFDLV
jgi:Ca2+-binding RTX toxin-like protein